MENVLFVVDCKLNDHEKLMTQAKQPNRITAVVLSLFSIKRNSIEHHHSLPEEYASKKPKTDPHLVSIDPMTTMFFQ